MPSDSGRVTPETISFKEANARIGGNPQHAYTLLREGRYPVRTIRRGSRILVPVKALEEYLNGEHGGSHSGSNRAA